MTMPDRPAGFDWKALDERGKAFGKEAEAAAERLSRDPSLLRAADVAGVVGGVILLAIGAWFLADVTLGLDLPVVHLGEVWPLALVALGLAVVASGATRRRP